MDVPSVKEVRALHEKHAPTPAALDLVYTHCEIVWKIAEQLLARSAVHLDAELVRAGCLLHDIGVYRLYNSYGELDHTNYVKHGVLGHDLLRAEGLPTALCRFCSCHTGAGLTRLDIQRQRLPLPAADYVATTGEESLVMYADKFHSKSAPPRFVSGDDYAAYVRRFGDQKLRAFQQLRHRFGDPDLAPFVAADQHAHPANHDTTGPQLSASIELAGRTS